MSEPVSTDVIVADDAIDTTVSALDKVERLKNPGTVVFSTIDGSTFAGRLATVSALQNSVPLNEHLGEVINLRNIVTQVVEVNDTESKRRVQAVRSILIDEDGTAYHAISDGVIQALQTFLGALGSPSEWPEPVKVAAVEERARSGFR